MVGWALPPNLRSRPWVGSTGDVRAAQAATNLSELPDPLTSPLHSTLQRAPSFPRLRPRHRHRAPRRRQRLPAASRVARGAVVRPRRCRRRNPLVATPTRTPCRRFSLLLRARRPACGQRAGGSIAARVGRAGCGGHRAGGGTAAARTRADAVPLPGGWGQPAVAADAGEVAAAELV